MKTEPNPSEMFCDGAQEPCGTCVSCLLGARYSVEKTERSGELTQERLAVVRTRLALASDGLAGPLTGLPIILASVGVLVLAVVVHHGATIGRPLFVGGGAALAVALVAALPIPPKTRIALLVVAPLALLGSVVVPALSHGPVACGVLETFFTVAAAVIGFVLGRAGRATPLGWLFGTVLSAFGSAVAVHAVCSASDTFGHVLLLHVAPAVVLALVARLLVERLAPLFPASGGVAERPTR